MVCHLAAVHPTCLKQKLPNELLLFAHYSRLLVRTMEENFKQGHLRFSRFRRVARRMVRAPGRFISNLRTRRAIRPPSQTGLENIRFVGNLLLIPYTLYNLAFAPAGLYQLIFGNPLGPEAGFFRSGMLHAWFGTALFLLGAGYCIFKLVSRSRVTADSHLASRHYGANPELNTERANGGSLAGHFALMAGCLTIIGLGSYAAQVFPGPLQLLLRSFNDPNQLLPALPGFWNVFKGFLQVGPLTGVTLLTWVAYRERGRS